MFRIIFDPREGVFKVQLLCWGFWWVNVRSQSATVGEMNTYIDRNFGNYDLARQWVRTIGLDKAYQEQASHAAWANGGVLK